jgi:hypothetical protein
MRERRWRVFSASCSPIGPRPPIGAPVRPPIGTWPHIGADTGGHVFRCGPHLHTFDVDNEIGIVRFIQWQRGGAGDLAGHGDSGPRWEGRWIEEFPVDGLVIELSRIRGVAIDRAATVRFRSSCRLSVVGPSTLCRRRPSIDPEKSLALP